MSTFTTKSGTQQPTLSSLQVPDTGNVELNAYLTSLQTVLIQSANVNPETGTIVPPTTPVQESDNAYSFKYLQIGFADNEFGTGFGNRITANTNFWCFKNDSGGNGLAVVDSMFGNYTAQPMLNGFRDPDSNVFNQTLWYQINPGRVVRFSVADANLANNYFSNQPGWYTFDTFNMSNGAITRNAYTPLDLDISTVSQTGRQPDTTVIDPEATIGVLNLNTNRYTNTGVVYTEMQDGIRRYVDVYAHSLIAQRSNAFNFAPGYVQADFITTVGNRVNTFGDTVVTQGNGLFISGDGLQYNYYANDVVQGVDADSAYAVINANGLAMFNSIYIQRDGEVWGNAHTLINNNTSAFLNQCHANSVWTDSLLYANGMPWNFGNGSGGGGNGSPGGLSYTVQYNNAGAFGGSANLSWDPFSNTFLVNQSIFYSNNRIQFSNSTILDANDSPRLTLLESDGTFFQVNGNGRAGGEFWTIFADGSVNFAEDPSFGYRPNVGINKFGDLVGGNNIEDGVDNGGIFSWGRITTPLNTQTYSNGSSNFGRGNAVINPTQASVFRQGIYVGDTSNVSRYTQIQNDGDIFGGYAGFGNISWGNLTDATNRLVISADGSIRTDKYQFANGNPVPFGGGGSGSPGGPNLSLQFNLNGTFQGESSLAYDYTRNLLNLSNGSIESDFATGNPFFVANARTGLLAVHYANTTFPNPLFEVDAHPDGGDVSIRYAQDTRPFFFANARSGQTAIGIDRADNAALVISKGGPNANRLEDKDIGTFVDSFVHYANFSAGESGFIEVDCDAAPSWRMFGYSGILNAIFQPTISASANVTNARFSLFRGDPIQPGGAFFVTTDNGRIFFLDGAGTQLYSCGPDGQIPETHIFRPAPALNANNSSFVASFTSRTNFGGGANSIAFGVQNNGRLRMLAYSNGPTDPSTTVGYVPITVGNGNYWIPIVQ